MTTAITVDRTMSFPWLSFLLTYLLTYWTRNLLAGGWWRGRQCGLQLKRTERRSL